MYQWRSYVWWIGTVSTLLTLGGCQSDTTGCDTNDDCRGERLCLQGVCRTPVDRPDAGTDAMESPDGERPDGGLDTSSPPDVSRDAPLGEVSVDTGPDTSLPPPPDVIEDPSDSGDTTPPRDVDVDVPDSRDVTPPRDVRPETSPDTRPDSMPPPDVSPDTPLAGPRIRVRPANQIDFGGILVRDSVDRTLRISNTGNQPLRVTQIGLDQTPSSGFAVSGPNTPNSIAPGTTAKYTVTFNPTQEARYRNSVVIQSNATNRQQPVQVQLEGLAANAQPRRCIYTAPETVDFGVVAPGNSRTRTFKVVNCSQNQSVEVRGFQFQRNPNGVFNITSQPSTPLTLNTGQSRTVDVTFNSQSRSQVTGEILIDSNEQSRRPEIVNLEASGGGCARADARARVPGVNADRFREGPIAVPPQESVELDGRESTSPSGQISYQWTITSKPSGSNASLSSATAARPSFAPQTPGAYEVKLEVRDPVFPNRPACSSDTIEIVRFQREPALSVSLQWQADHDLDLRLKRSDSNGSFSGPGTDTLTPSNLSRNWGNSSVRVDDPFHLGNAEAGGPNQTSKSEAIVLGELEPSRDYRVLVRFADRDGVRPFRFGATARVEFRRNVMPGQLQRSFSIQETGDTWLTFEIDGQTQSIRNLNRIR